jgi:KUP system potassium uptake protein
MPDTATAPTSTHGAVATTAPESFWALALGSIGVVFGDIGTSPLYALREALAHTRAGIGPEVAVLGVVSLVAWALILIVTVKYVSFLMRADNSGEGGTLALTALSQRSLAARSGVVFLIGIVGASLFYGDGIITPAMSVLSAVEGVRDAPGAPHGVGELVLPVSAAILVALFLAQARGTASVAKFFGPITAVWFLVLAGLGLYHIADDLSVLRAFSPYYGIVFLLDNGVLGFVILGSVFLAVTGAEALYADMGHFGKNPIRVAWLGLVLPALLLNYLGQGALVLHHPAAAVEPFYRMIPKPVYWPVLLLAMVATIIASQAVITGAFSMTQQAVQLSLLPRIEIRRTSETQAGQIFVPQVNTMLMVGVLVLLFAFRSSSNLAAAYGIAVTGAMFVDTLLFFVIVRFAWKKPLWMAVLACALFGALDVVFITSNLLKFLHGAWLPLALGACLVVVMWTWTRGGKILADKVHRESIPLSELALIVKNRAPFRAPGTAIFLTSDPETAPVALMHNLKHNKVLHEKNVILTLRTAATPRVRDEDRVRLQPVSEDFTVVILNYGFMESPHVPRGLALARHHGLKIDIMATSFFLGRRSVVPSAHSGMPLWQDKLFIYLLKNAANPTDFYKIPPGRVVELGTQVTV